MNENNTNDICQRNREMNSPIPALHVENISKRYPRKGLLFGLKAQPDAPQVLRDVSFAIKRGETVGLLGPNGAGKTTLMKIIAAMLYPDSGRVLLHGRDLAQDPVQARKSMGLITCDERSFYWRLTGRHNLLFFATLYGLPKKLAAERIQSLLEVLGLAEAAERPFQSYSSGMKQKLAIARGLLSNPDIVLYDEPTRSLDPLSAQNIRKWIVRNRGENPQATHLLATNLLHEAEMLCDRVIIINRGAPIASGTIEDIKKEWRGREYAIHRITCGNFPADAPVSIPSEEGLIDIHIQEREGDRITFMVKTLESSTALSWVLDSFLRSGRTIIRCESEEVPFDEVFCSLVTGDSNPSGVTGKEDRA